MCVCVCVCVCVLKTSLPIKYNNLQYRKENVEK